jgi:hypothetical protein
VFERFTDRARYVLVLAQEEARLLAHPFIGTEHILLGLAHHTEGMPAQVLAERGLTLEVLRQQVEGIIGHSAPASVDSPPFTPRAKKVLELSLREALDLGHDHIGPEHILLGLVAEGEGVATQVLVRSGIDLDELCRTVEERMGARAREPGQRRRAGRIARLTSRASVSIGEVMSSGGARPPARLVSCHFCGRRPPESGRLVHGGGAFICEVCIREWQEKLEPAGAPSKDTPEAELYQDQGTEERDQEPD